MALQPSIYICGAQLGLNYNAGNGRATSFDLTTPIPVHFIITLTNGTVIDRTVQPGSYSWPLPANQVRITIDAQGEATITGVASIGAGN